MDNLQELLTITMEECAEVSVEASKMIRFQNKGDNLESEIGDLLCMITLLDEQGVINLERANLCAMAKREKLKQWSSLQNL